MKFAQLSFIDATAIGVAGTGWLTDPAGAVAISYDCIHPHRQDCGHAIIYKDKLKVLAMLVGYDLTLKEVVDRLGKPDYVNYGMVDPIGECSIVLDWPNKAISVSTYDQYNAAMCQMIVDDKGIKLDVLVREIAYGVPESFGTGTGGCCTRIAWPGFGKQ